MREAHDRKTDTSMSNETNPQPEDLAKRLGRISARAVRQARPRIKRLAGDAKPLVDKAARYAADHQDEIRDAGAKLVRARLRGPLGMAFDAVAKAAQPASKDVSVANACPSCAAENPKGARFCNQCAAPLTSEP